jgi:hypothetical protein
LFLQESGHPFTVEDVYNCYKGKSTTNDKQVLEAYRYRIKKLAGIDIKEVTYQKNLESGKHLQGFIRYKYNAKDIHLMALGSSFFGSKIIRLIFGSKIIRLIREDSIGENCDEMNRLFKNR